MKIAIPVEEQSLNAFVYSSFGRAPLFLIYNIDTKDFSIINNNAAESQSGAGVQAAQIVIDSGADGIIAFNCGDKAEMLLKAAGIKVYKAKDASVEENLISLKNNELLIL